MALVVGNRVRPRLTSSTLGAVSRLQPQPPTLGVVTQVTDGDPDVILATFAETGITFSNNASALVPTGCRDDALDLIEAPSDLIRTTYMNKVVVGLRAVDPAPPLPVPDLNVYSQEYIGRVVDVFNVNGVATVLIKSLSNGMYYELPIVRVRLLTNR